MENKITASGLAAMLALATGKQKELCENFVSELFVIVNEELSKGENVRIKGFGTFKLVEVEPRKSVNVVTGEDYEIPGHTKVVFVMAKELAALVNEPFGAFEAVEIADELPTDDLDGDVEVEDFSKDTTQTESLEDTVVAENPEEIVDAPNPSSQVINFNDIEESEQDEEEEDNGESFWKRYRFIIGFIAGVCASILIGWLAISFADYLKPSPQMEEKIVEAEELEVKDNSVAVLTDSVAEEKQQEATVAKADDASESQESVPTKPSDAPVYDTVTTTRYLTTIAQEHYGNFNLWPIIYEENAAILGHPDRIRPGTKVVVPPLSKYGIDPKNKAQVNEIKAKGAAIYAKYK